MVKPKTKPKQDDPEQSRRFMETAKEVDALGNGDALERVLKASKKQDTKNPPPSKSRGGETG
jgi:hypothetical protein